MRPRVVIAIAALAVVLVGLRACFGPEEPIAFLLYDDAYYYLGVARHLAAGHGSTFDGLHATNGYHPLWCAVLVPLTAAFRDPGHAVRAAGVLWFAFAAAVPFAAYWALVRRCGPSIAAIAAAGFTLQPWIGLALARPNGLETPLVTLAVLAVVGAVDRVFVRVEPPRWRGVVGVGVLLGLAILARLDAGALAVAVAGLVLIAGSRAWGWRAAAGRVLVVALAAGAVAGPSLVWNTLRFGSPLPVSGQVVGLEAEQERAALGGALSAANIARRARYAVLDIPAVIARRAALGLPGERWVAASGRYAGAGVSAVVVLAAWLAWKRRCTSGVTAGDGALLLGAFAALHYATYVLWLWTPGEDVYRAYYFVPELLALSLLAAWWLHRARPFVVVIVLSLLGLHLVIESERYLALLDAKPGRVANRFVYGWIRSNLPADTVLGARDAGKLLWFSGRTVIGLDGLNNDAAFVDVLRAGAVGKYVCDSPIAYVLIDRPYLAEYLDDLRRTATCAFLDTDPASHDWAIVRVER